MRRLSKPLPPDAAERRHLVTMRHIWRVAEGIIERALLPLYVVWPIRGDADELPPPPSPASPPQRPGAPTPLSPPPRLPRMSRMSDAELRRLWPELDPDALRRFAPWAVTHDEVRRLAASAGTPTELERLVARAIELERAAAPTRPAVTPATWEVVRDPEAFVLRLPPETRAIFGPDGPLPPPPMPREVTLQTITRQLEWAQLALETQITDERIRPAVAGAQRMLESHTHDQLQRVLAIDLNRDLPELRGQRELWYSQHVELIESGILAEAEEVQLRPSLLADVRRTIIAAHERGLRVEVLAGVLKERYGVAEKRAELIARDQVLKANGRLTRARQEAVGVTQYRWVTARDARVRDAHRALHGTIQSWDAPPPVGKGRHEHPGGDYQCRCQAVPIAPDWLSEGVEPMPVAAFPSNPRTGTR